MAKLQIDNQSDAVTSDSIEKTITLILASTLTSLSKLKLLLKEVRLENSGRPGFCCQIKATLPNSQSVKLSTENPEARSAIEGAIFRLKRDIVRSRQGKMRMHPTSERSRASSGGAASDQDTADSASPAGPS